MPYCLKCGSKVEDKMTFCPECGTQIKSATPNGAPSAEPSVNQEKADKNQQQQTPNATPVLEKQHKPEHGFIRYLVAGLILITVGISAILELTNPKIAFGTLLAAMLLTIGVIVILGSVYYALSGRKHTSTCKSDEPAKKPASPTS